MTPTCQKNRMEARSGSDRSLSGECRVNRTNTFSSFPRWPNLAQQEVCYIIGCPARALQTLNPYLGYLHKKFGFWSGTFAAFYCYVVKRPQIRRYVEFVEFVKI